MHAERQVQMELNQNSAVGPKDLWEVEYRYCLPVSMQENGLKVLLKPHLSLIHGAAQCTNGFRKGRLCRETCKAGWNFQLSCRGPYCFLFPHHGEYYHWPSREGTDGGSSQNQLPWLSCPSLQQNRQGLSSSGSTFKSTSIVTILSPNHTP